MASIGTKGLSNIGESLKKNVADLLTNSDFISRTIGMSNSYEDIMFLVQLLGHEPVSLLGKNYTYIYDHVRRNYLQGTEIMSTAYGNSNCPKFTFYKEKPTIRFANPYDDPMNFKEPWVSEMRLEGTSVYTDGEGITIHYSESNDGYTNNKSIGYRGDIDGGNPGTAYGAIYSFGPKFSSCDIINKTNANFNNGKYKTLIARFHTNSDDSKTPFDSTQSANSRIYGMSHGRNLLKRFPEMKNGYDNPYCRVWTYHHQYNQLARAIRPFGGISSAEDLVKEMGRGYVEDVGFRTLEDKENGFDGAGKRLNNLGVLNYRNNMVTIAPTAKIKDYFEHMENDADRQAFSAKRCMFSIENLAWKDRKAKNDEYDEYGLSPEQRGPLGGRIMWFPPYDLQFNENVNVDWNPNKFIGRGENVYTYTNTERSGNLSFTLIIDHPSILDYWTGLDRNGMKNNGISLTKGNSGGVDNQYNQEQTLLRFFAGCEILTAKPQEYRTRNFEPSKQEKEPQKQNSNPKETEVKKPKTKKLYCILYYPNNYSGKDDEAIFAINYLMFGKGTQKIINDRFSVEDITPTLDETSRGYEMGENGISFHTWEEISGKTNYGITTSGASSNVIIGVESAENQSGKIGDFAKIVDATAVKAPNDTTSNKSRWKLMRWYYRVDKATTVQELVEKPYNYIDGKSYKLNSSGYNWVKSEIPAFKLNDDDELVAFSDLYIALTDESRIKPCDEGNIDKLRKMLKQEDGYKITKLTFRGHNSSHGRNSSNKVNESRNKTLSESRALTFKRWMEKMKFPMASEADAKDTLNETNEVNNHKLDDVDNQYIKAWRSASVVIEYEKSDIVNAAIAEPITVDKDGNPNVVKTNIPNKNSSDNIYNTVSFNLEEASVELRKSSLEDKALKEGKQEDYYTNQLSWDYKLNDGFSVKSGTVHRYDNEGEFFEALPTDAPFLHHLITEKIKYFDPAFHSISPEGFNARLTFLHQCTRQGATVENNSATDASTAYNLAFGRPPVCVLRIGDFYYTKIIIDSLSIQYETPQWDLNPEGIGVMPMFAKISMNFKFLGGSDLGGPIARLQNAVSFNYYANTSVYDNRAEMVQYNENGSGQEVKYKGWIYPNENTKKDK